MNNLSFKRDFAAALAQAGEKAELVVRQAALQLASDMVNGSAVGEPSGWAINAKVVADKTAYIDAAIAYNDANPGKRKKGVGKATLNKKFKLKSTDYTGGRFKGNWVAAIGTVDTSNDAPPDKNGGATIGRIKAVLAGWKAGQTIYLSNSMPYSRVLEYEGHSKQMPSGVVRINVQNFGEALARAVREVKK